MRGDRGWQVLALLCTAQFVLVLDVTIVAVALPSVRGSLGFSAAGLQWVISLGVASVASTARGTAAVPAERQGLASGVLNTAAQVGTALGLAVLVTVASARTVALTPAGAQPSSAAVVDGYRWAILGGGMVAAAATVVVAAVAEGAFRRRAAPVRGRPDG